MITNSKVITRQVFKWHTAYRFIVATLVALLNLLPAQRALARIQVDADKHTEAKTSGGFSELGEEAGKAGGRYVAAVGGIITGVVLLGAAAVWYFFLRSPAESETANAETADLDEDKSQGYGFDCRQDGGLATITCW